MFFVRHAKSLVLANNKITTEVSSRGMDEDRRTNPAVNKEDLVEEMQHKGASMHYHPLSL